MSDLVIGFFYAFSFIGDLAMHPLTVQVAMVLGLFAGQVFLYDFAPNKPAESTKEFLISHQVILLKIIALLIVKFALTISISYMEPDSMYAAVKIFFFPLELYLYLNLGFIFRSLIIIAFAYFDRRQNTGT